MGNADYLRGFLCVNFVRFFEAAVKTSHYGLLPRLSLVRCEILTKTYSVPQSNRSKVAMVCESTFFAQCRIGWLKLRRSRWYSRPWTELSLWLGYLEDLCRLLNQFGES